MKQKNKKITAKKREVSKRSRVLHIEKNYKQPEEAPSIIFDSKNPSTDSLFISNPNVQEIVLADNNSAEMPKPVEMPETEIIQKKEGVFKKFFSFAKYPFKNLFSSMFMGLVFAGLFSAVFYVLALPYAPGETTNPTCSPGTANCTVTASVPYTGATAALDLGARNLTTTGTGSFGSLTLTTSALTVGNGGIGLSTIAAGSILGANALDTLTAITSTSGTKILTNTAGTITWETASSGMTYPGAGIAVSTGSAWDTSITAANISSLAGLSYASTSFVKMTNANTFTLDTSAYTTNPMTTAGDLIYASDTATPATPARLAAGTTGQILQTNTGAAPTWSTATYPATTTANGILYSSATNTVADNANLTFDGTNLEVGGVGDSQILSSSGSLILGGVENVNNETLTFDFETTANTAAITSATGVTLVDFGTININSGGYIAGNPIITGTVASGPPETTPADGAMIIDSGDGGRLYIRYGSAWHYIAATAGFQIPEFETTDPISGDKMEEGDIVLGMVNQTFSDGALHGVWVKWDSVKAQLLAEARGELADFEAEALSTDGTAGNGEVKGVKNNTLLDKVANVLVSLGISIKDGVTNITNLAVQKSTTEVARIKKMEMVDSSTNEIYCTWIQDGEWIKTKGECGSLEVANASVQPSQQEEAAQQAQNLVQQAKQIAEETQQAIEETANNAVAQVQEAAEEVKEEEIKEEKIKEEKIKEENTEEVKSDEPAGEITPEPEEPPVTEEIPAEEVKETAEVSDEIPEVIEPPAEEKDKEKDKEKEKDNNSEPNVIESSVDAIGDVIQDSAAGLLNSILDFISGIFSIGIKQISSLPFIEKTTAGILQGVNNEISLLQNTWQTIIRLLIK